MPELARITDTLKLPNGELATGRILITPSGSFIAADGAAISAAPVAVEIVAGVVDIELAPTEEAEQVVTYRAEYEISGMAKYTETWTVGRAVDGPFTISQARGTG